VVSSHSMNPEMLTCQIFEPTAVFAKIATSSWGRMNVGESSTSTKVQLHKRRSTENVCTLEVTTETGASRAILMRSLANLVIG
jgi:hypothetical protein